LRDGSANLTAAGFNVSSDEELKEEIRPIPPGALDRLDLYRGILYRLKGTALMRAGHLAGDFRKARPEAVSQGKLGLEICVAATLAEHTEALREAREECRALAKRVAELEATR
jgi:hypothetical protein